jgi:hypothetical protein
MDVPGMTPRVQNYPKKAFLPAGPIERACLLPLDTGQNVIELPGAVSEALR